MIKDRMPRRRNDDAKIQRADEGVQIDHAKRKPDNASGFMKSLAIVRAAMERLAKRRANKDR